MTTYRHDQAPICVCGEQMVERRNKATGDRFYGCKKFPHCRHTEQIDPLKDWRSEDND